MINQHLTASICSKNSGYAAKMLLKLDHPFTAEELKVIESQSGIDQSAGLTDSEAKQCILLSDNGTGKDIAYLIKLLGHNNDSVRVEAANAILHLLYFCIFQVL